MSAEAVVETAPIPEDTKPHRFLVASIVLITGIILLVIGFVFSISYGAVDTGAREVINTIFSFNPDDPNQQIIHELRIPRAISAILIGACLAVSGAIMQGITRNPLATPSIMGLTQGSGLAIAIMMVVMPAVGYNGLVIASFIGAALGVAIVYGITAMTPGGVSPLKLVLAGTVVSSLFGAISSGLAIYFKIAQDLSFFSAGGLTMIRWDAIEMLLPIAVVCLIASIAMGRYITLLSFGEEVAIGLGQRVGLVKLGSVILILLMTGASVSVAGGVGFVGLVIPHIVRSLVGTDYRLIIPCSAVLGGVLIVYADIVSRWVNAPYVTPLGAITAMIGVPFFLYLARKEGRDL
ncbi:FecCD family ABC transporter permease [Priestia taiwanensis]|uniref:Ferrichrome ABC transporter permease n=1 Tax=Priestia taiwanensis TaxID=1347902 RepID=A0A917ALS9_9BACI|nr:iron ABC transporter permease [Priestia taiwanensis]MBM7362024.1 iron complex transport system permease protein [Priestia taiwanensis]GGE58844.1 ferrichrome ABC transporter permease [Priestia taiwanensis]